MKKGTKLTICIVLMFMLISIFGSVVYATDIDSHIDEIGSSYGVDSDYVVLDENSNEKEEVVTQRVAGEDQDKIDKHIDVVKSDYDKDMQEVEKYALEHKFSYDSYPSYSTYSTPSYTSHNRFRDYGIVLLGIVLVIGIIIFVVISINRSHKNKDMNMRRRLIVSGCLFVIGSIFVVSGYKGLTRLADVGASTIGNMGSGGDGADAGGYGSNGTAMGTTGAMGATGVNGYAGQTGAAGIDGLAVSSESDYSSDIAIDDMPEIDWNTDNFKAVTESGFVVTEYNPFSTFGADVDTASYATFRKQIFGGWGRVYASSLRIEEFVNYFDYDYASPEDSEKFGVTKVLTECPWNKDNLLLKVGIKAEEIKDDDKGSNIVFLIDTSGSMFDSDKLPLVQKSFHILLNNLDENDRISIVTYAGNDQIYAEGVHGDSKELGEIIDGLNAGGGTNGAAGINTAYKLAKKYYIDGGNNRVILATDGDLNIGISSESDLIDLIEDKKESGIFLSCLGFGTDNYQDVKMESLADKGNGNYYYIDSLKEADKVLNKEFFSTVYTVAKDTKFQIDFNPANIKAYKLLGYENRKMAAEDFADDTKDGGEVGSGQMVTVLYELIPSWSENSEVPVLSSKYDTGNKGVEGDELFSVNIRYKEPDGNTSELREYPVMKSDIGDIDEDTLWAAGVAEFVLLARGSKSIGDVQYADIYDMLKSTPKVMDDDFRAEFLYMVKQASKDQNLIQDDFYEEDYYGSDDESDLNE